MGLRCSTSRRASFRLPEVSSWAEMSTGLVNDRHAVHTLDHLESQFVAERTSTSSTHSVACGAGVVSWEEMARGENDQLAPPYKTACVVISHIVAAWPISARNTAIISGQDVSASEHATSG